MTASFLVLAFGDLERGVWGSVWMIGASGSTTAVLGAGDAGAPLAGAALLGDDGGPWRLEGDRAELSVSAVGEPVAPRASENSLGGFDQLCRVSGRFELDGAEHAVDCLGLRHARGGKLDLAQLGSLRAVSSWFEPDEGMVLVAQRPRKAKGQDRDLISAAVLGPDGSAAVEDPRLSTTYSSEGWPMRAGLELWIGGEDQHEQYPRRASGEATGPRVQAAAGELEFRAEPFRWHSRGREGAGVYALLRRA